MPDGRPSRSPTSCAVFELFRISSSGNLKGIYFACWGCVAGAQNHLDVALDIG